MSLNKNLNKAKRKKNDDFYTQLPDIENELKHYRPHFAGKVIYCNCDDPKISNFYKYFSLNFAVLGLKKLITTCYRNKALDLFSDHTSEKAIWLECNRGTCENGAYVPSDPVVRHLDGDGDFRSDECVNLLKQADIVVTNPPFSLFREYVSQLIEHDKKFIIIGTQNAVTYKEIFPLIKENRFWLGYGFAEGNAYFAVPSDINEYADGVYDEKTGLVKFRNVTWFTNLDHEKRHEELPLYKHYSPEEYPHYDNYDAINVDKIAKIPVDWDGVMGVPITFLDKYNPRLYEILGITDRKSPLQIKEYTKKDSPSYSNWNRRGVVKIDNALKPTYARIMIRRKQP